MPREDRLTALLEQSVKRVTGIDFIQVVDPEDQRLLRVFFLIDPDQLSDPIVETGNLPQDVSVDSVAIVSTSGGEALARVPIVRVTYRPLTINGETRTVLEVETDRPGDFSIYRLNIVDTEGRIDWFFNNVPFSFKQGCPSVLDCRRRDLACPPEELVDFPIDYLARDFTSLRGALLDFAAQRYPDWTTKIEADAGVMLAEVMAALGDELSYIQDRYAREAHLETLSQRRSLRHHTRLVDYALRDGHSPSTFLDLRVKTGGVFVAAGSRVWAPVEGGAPIPFELGQGLADTVADQGGPLELWVHEAWNEMSAHVPDTDNPCLPVGATELFLQGALPTSSQVPTGEDVARFWIGKWLLLQTQPADPSLPARRHMIRVAELEQTEDPLVLDSSLHPLPVTRIRWEEGQALPFEICLSDLRVHGNLVSATAGETFTELFRIRSNDGIPEAMLDAVVPAVERQGPLNDVTGRRTITFLYSLKETEERGLGWLGHRESARPEIELVEVDPASLSPRTPPDVWLWEASLLDSRGFEDKFALEDGTWRRIIGFRRIGEVIEHVDYASGAGFTIRFGDGEFGRIPADGTVLRARYRTGPGRKANLPADTVVYLEHPDDPTINDLGAVLEGVRNPLPITDGADPEDAQVVKQIAPEAFRALTFRAVRPEDYAEVAERLPWVQRAGARFRWTGSWLSAFVSVDPLGAFDLSPQRRSELEDVLDCVRQAGREVFVRRPRFVNLDLEVAICLEASAYAGQVKARVLEALVGRRGAQPLKGFFHPDNFTFGTALRRARLEAAIQGVPGVYAVERIRIRARGLTDWRQLDELSFPVGDDQILRLQNDPRFPERGSVRVVVRAEQPEAEEVVP